MKPPATPVDWSFEDILGQRVETESTEEEGRRYPRYECRRSIEVVIHSVENGRRPARCFLISQDISRSGVKFIHAVELMPGQKVEITFDSMPTKHAEVMWSKKLPNKHYAIGCKFVIADESKSS